MSFNINHSFTEPYNIRFSPNIVRFLNVAEILKYRTQHCMWEDVSYIHGQSCF